LEVRVLCMVVRRKSDCKEARYQDRLKVLEWELPVCEVTLAADPPAAATHTYSSSSSSGEPESG
ncbi:MAG: hypothetical protein U1G05_04295, partial [Kiritimatiellia bacterium]